MHVESILIGATAALVCLAGLILIVQPRRKQNRRLGTKAKAIKACLTGLGLIISFISGTVAVDYLGSPSVEKKWSPDSLMALLCVVLPIGFLTVVGSYIWYSRQDTTRQFFSRRLTEIIQKSKEEK
jgi:hypothetical protein